MASWDGQYHGFLGWPISWLLGMANLLSGCHGMVTYYDDSNVSVLALQHFLQQHEDSHDLVLILRGFMAVIVHHEGCKVASESSRMSEF